MSNQNKNGKAFEYSLAITYFDFLTKHTKVSLIENEELIKAKSNFENLDAEIREKMISAAKRSLGFIIDIEPRLINAINIKDILEIELASDSLGQKGDVRDVIFLRASSKWEIGFSAKNNHRALKHSRLSHILDFGKQWIDEPCSDEYWKSISSVFDNIKKIKEIDKNAKWKESFKNKHLEVYKPLLKAWRKEVLNMSENVQEFSQKFVHYLIGYNDFYKIVKGKTIVEIHGFNINGTLNKPHGKIKAKHKIGKIKLPTRLIDLSFKPNTLTTLIATFDDGWQISFRIHSAGSILFPSLKFDIQLVSIPNSLFKTDLFID